MRSIHVALAGLWSPPQSYSQLCMTSRRREVLAFLDSRRTAHASSIRGALFSSSSSSNQPPLIRTVHSDLDWNDRIGLQDKWTNAQKGWHVNVEWRQTPFGVGLFALQDVDKDTVLRTGKLGVNLCQFQSIYDVQAFCRPQGQSQNGGAQEGDVDPARLLFFKDYLWGFDKHADERGAFSKHQNDNNEEHEESREEDRFYGMWIPGNGLNHNVDPNTIYQWKGDGIDLVALEDITEGDELYDDYRRHGKAPTWLRDFAETYQVSLNFADCNDFVDNPRSE